MGLLTSDMRLLRHTQTSLAPAKAAERGLSVDVGAASYYYGSALVTLLQRKHSQLQLILGVGALILPTFPCINVCVYVCIGVRVCATCYLT